MVQHWVLESNDLLVPLHGVSISIISPGPN